MKDNQPEIGDLVFVQGRKHPTKQGWFDCYGIIVVVQHEDEFDDSDVETVTIRFEDSNTTMEVLGSDLTSWDDQHKSWNVTLEHPNDIS